MAGAKGEHGRYRRHDRGLSITTPATLAPLAWFCAYNSSICAGTRLRRSLLGRYDREVGEEQEGRSTVRRVELFLPRYLVAVVGGGIIQLSGGFFLCWLFSCFCLLCWKACQL